MARPKEEGLQYFPFDVDFFNDEKVEAISGEFGIKGEIAIIKLLCAVYRNGYFISWTEMLKMKLLRNLPGISPELLDQIVNRLVKWGFFDKTLFDTDKILTSRGIQRRYFSAVKRRVKSGNYPYLLVSVDINPNETGFLHAETPQSKGKESKENNIPPLPSNEGIPPVDNPGALKKKLEAAQAAALKRKEEFYNSLVPHVERYGKEMIRAFFDYWSEFNKSQTRMRFELQKTWELTLRLINWERKEKVAPKRKSNFANLNNEQRYEDF